MRGPHNIWRLIRTGATFERTGAMAVALQAMEVTPRLRLAARMLGWPFKWLGLKGDPGLPYFQQLYVSYIGAYVIFAALLGQIGGWF